MWSLMESGDFMVTFLNTLFFKYSYFVVVIIRFLQSSATEMAVTKQKQTSAHYFGTFRP